VIERAVSAALGPRLH